MNTALPSPPPPPPPQLVLIKLCLYSDTHYVMLKIVLRIKENKKCPVVTIIVIHQAPVYH